MGEVDSGRGDARVGTGDKWEISVPSSQFCYESKTLLKKKPSKPQTESVISVPL